MALSEQIHAVDSVTQLKHFVAHGVALGWMMLKGCQQQRENRRGGKKCILCPSSDKHHRCGTPPSTRKWFLDWMILMGCQFQKGHEAKCHREGKHQKDGNMCIWCPSIGKRHHCDTQSSVIKWFHHQGEVSHHQEG